MNIYNFGYYHWRNCLDPTALLCGEYACSVYILIACSKLAFHIASFSLSLATFKYLQVKGCVRLEYEGHTCTCM